MERKRYGIISIYAMKSIDNVLSKKKKMKKIVDVKFKVINYITP